jgi:hypothetical protein
MPIYTEGLKMVAIKYLLLFGADLVLIGVPTFYVTICLSKPEIAVLLATKRSNWPDAKLATIKGYSLVIVSWIGIGIIIYHGISFLFSWMPHSWGHYNDDDEYETTAEALAFLGAFFGSMALLDSLSEAAHKTVKLKQENEALRYSLDRIRKAGPG